ncbi:hypothetical protein BGZ70_003111, partial [Mortierella alpina]
MVATTQYEQTSSGNCWGDPAVGTILQRDQHIAVASLVSGDLDKLDPPIGDSSCQVRALVVLVFYHRLFKEFGHTEWEKAVGLSLEYLKFHRIHSGGSVKSAQPVKRRAVVPHEQREAHHDGTIINMQFLGLVALVRKTLGEQRFELLGLAYSLWSGGIVSTDEFWIDFRYRSNNLWGQHERFLRARLAKLSCAAMIDLAGELPNAGKWVQLLRETKSVIKRRDAEGQDDEEDVEVLCAQSTFHVALAALYHYSIPIVDGNIRIQLNGTGDCDHDEGHCSPLGDRLHQPLQRLEMENIVSCNSASCKMTYSLGTVRALFYIPNKMTGAFEYVSSPSQEQMRMPCFFLKTWSTYHGHCSTNYRDNNSQNSNNSSISIISEEDKERDNLYSPDHDRYYEALIKVDKSWAIEVMASTHPPFSRRAQHAGLDISPVYERIFGRSHKNFRYDRYGIEGENILTPEVRRQWRQKDHLPALTDRLITARQVSHERQLSGECQFVRMGAPSTECTWRITKAIDWNVVHVHAATYGWVKEQLQALAGRHQDAPGAVIGRFVFSQGAVGASHENKELATKLHNTRQSN